MTRVLDLLEAAAAHRSSVRFLPDGTVTSFTELWKASGRAAGSLSAFAKGEVIAGILTSCPSSIATLVGAWRAGLTFVSLPLPHRGQDPAAYGAFANDVCAETGAAALAIEARYEPLLAGIRVPLLRTEELAERATSGRSSDDGELVQFSSGTVSAPKQVRLSQEAIAANVQRFLDRLAVRPGDVSCQWIPLSHDMGLIGGLLGAWTASNSRYLEGDPGSYTCLRPEAFLQRPSLWMEACSEAGATITAGPTFAYAIAARELTRAAPTLNLSPLRACIVGAEPVHASVLRRFEEAARPYGLSPSALTPAYGLAEAALCVTMVEPDVPWHAEDFRLDDESELSAGVSLVSCGTPLDGYDVDAGVTRPENILVRGPSVRRFGTDDDDGATNALDTGDLGFLSGGELFVVGRADDMLSVSGKAVRSEEIENVATTTSTVIRAGNCAATRCELGYALVFECRSHMDRELLEGECVRLRAALTRAVGVAPVMVLALESGTLPKTSSGKLRRRAVERELLKYRRSALCALVRGGG